MINKIESFLFGKVFGRVISRLAVSLAAFAVAQAASVGVDLDPVQVSSALIAGANAAYSAIKEWRDSRAAKAVDAPPAA